ncbi:MAG: hypothetical protein ACTTGW_03765 [Candidatus Cryptobacteroides sp.]
MAIIIIVNMFLSPLLVFPSLNTAAYLRMCSPLSVIFPVSPASRSKHDIYLYLKAFEKSRNKSHSFVVNGNSLLSISEFFKTLP